MDPHTINIAAKNTIAHLKSGKSIKDAYIRSIMARHIGHILPIGKEYIGSKEFSKYILENKEIFGKLSSGDADKNDFFDFIDEENKILFIVVNHCGDIVGHIFIKYDEALNQLVVCNYKFIDRSITTSVIGIIFSYFNQLLPVNNFLLKVIEADAELMECLKANGFSKEESNYIASPSSFNNPRIESWSWVDSVHMEKGIILTAGPSISSKELAYTFDAAENGWNLSHSCYIEKFERYFSGYLGVKYAIATSSCTGALQIALMALDIGPGDEVIVPDMTWVATANAVRYVGATPIFADIEYDTWTLDAGAVEQLITNKTKAIIPAHLYGHPANMTELVKISNKYNLHLIEDAAPAIGAEWEGKKCGTYGAFSAFSFQGAKLLVTGEGGMLVTDDESLYKKALKIWDQGRNPEKQFWIDGNGVKFKMSNMQAAFGLAQIERVDEQIQMKRRIFSWYEEQLRECKNINLNTEPKLGKSIYWMTSITINEGSGIERSELIKHLKNKNIDSRIVFPPISQYPIWGREVSPGVNAKNVGLRGINLPSGVGRNKGEIQYIASTIRKFISQN